MARYTNSTIDALRELTGPALEFLVELERDCAEALALAGLTVRASDPELVEELSRLTAAHGKRTEAIAKARE